MIYAAFTNSKYLPVDGPLQCKMYCHVYYNTEAVATHSGVHKAISTCPSICQVYLLVSPLLKSTGKIESVPTWASGLARLVLVIRAHRIPKWIQVMGCHNGRAKLNILSGSRL